MALVSEEDEGSRSINALNFSMASDIVELVVLTSDEAFLQTLREAVGGARRLWHVLAPDKVSDLLVAGEVGIVVIDVASLRETAQVFVSEIKRQFPDLVIVVAGHRDAEISLAPAISAGTVYRFIHKPMSPNRARLFVEAAVRKYGEQRRAAFSVALPRSGSTLWYFALIGAGCAVALIAALVLSLHGPQPRAPLVAERAAPATAVTTVLGKASQALAANRLTTPPGDNALELYLQASALSPADPSARNGLAEVRERLLARAENALLEERLDEAAEAIETARRSGVEPARIQFLNAQLAKSREQLKAAQVAARARKDAGAQAAQNTAPQEKPAAPAPIDKAASLAGLAVERIAEGRLLEPDGDSARHYVAEALRADPASEVANEARQTLAARLLIEARAAIDRRDFARAAEWLQSAEGIALPDNIEVSRTLLQTARQQAQSDALAQLLKNGTDRLREDRLIEPAADSAKYYLLTLRGLDAQHAGLAAAMNELGTRLVAKARLALTLQQLSAARSWLDEAVALNVSGVDTSAVARDLEAASSQPPKTVSDIVPATQLTLLKSVSPLYPSRAQSGRVEGWVEVDFTVTETGMTRDAVVHAASPSGVFDEAATRAVSQWRYQPVERDGRPVPVHSRVRIRFTP